ncbi:MAG: Na+/H+ antiporter NhaA [Deltaproteobacteria bacterium]|nr:MAG: Na+/H+ antiporter NhaA [Deltaproteobacteria bacterium]
MAQRLSQPFVSFAQIETASALLLLAMTVVALTWANLPHYGETYHHFWELPLGVQLGSFGISLSLHGWVNDALMAIFFFVVGMEIKRELVAGELASLQRAMLPIFGALGGMVAPALIYTSFHFGGPAMRGWGIPMATDIAFAVAALSLLGSRVPPGLKVFLLALAIADDLGAIAVIAIFYTSDLSIAWMGTAAAIFAFVYAMNLAGVRAIPAYIVVGGFAWFATHESGVHATVAGVILGLLTPTVTDVPVRSVLDRTFESILSLREFVTRNDAALDNRHRQELLRRLSESREILSPLDFLTHRLEPWVGFVIMPIFALSNAGVVVGTEMLASERTVGVATAVALGLLIGKPIGITLFSYAAVKLRLATLPNHVNWTVLLATGLLAGIGFTVALFITSLAFEDPSFTDGAKVGILCASAAAGVLGVAVLARALPQR